MKGNAHRTDAKAVAIAAIGDDDEMRGREEC